ncbi:MAG: permease [Spirochaetia bacterium]|nr:permease [Spirochaetia bacterium]
MDTGTIYLVIAAILLLVSLVKDRTKTKNALLATGHIALSILPVLFFIFILMSFMQVFIPQKLIANLLGSGNGFFSILLGGLIGSFALIQPAAVFPFAGFLRDYGANYGAIFGFVMIAILMGISTLPLELLSFGKKFTIVRNVLTFVLVSLVGIVFLLLL